MSFVGKRAVGCVTYLRAGTELVLQGEQKWTDSTPLLIQKHVWNTEVQDRFYAVHDSRGNVRVLHGNDLAEAPNG